jgi:hypothetical protein
MLNRKDPRIEDAARQENRIPLRHGGAGLPYTPCVNRLLRIALAWLLVVALPAKGLAAASMVFCGPAHHGAASVAVQQGQPGHGHGGHEHGGHEHGGHDHAGDAHAGHAGHGYAGHAGVHTGGDGPDTPPGHDGMKHPTAKCSVCASCCSAAAIGSTAASVRVVPPVRDYAVVVTMPRPGVTPGGLERPPRSFLA